MHEKVEEKSKTVSDTKCAIAKIHFDFQNVSDVFGCFFF